MNTIDKGYDIINGPGRDALFDAFKYAYDKTSVISVNFVVAISNIKTRSGESFKIKTKGFKISSLEHEDGSGYSFNLQGYCEADTRLGSQVHYEQYNFKAYYNAKTRKGFITLTK